MNFHPDSIISAPHSEALACVDDFFGDSHVASIYVITHSSVSSLHFFGIIFSPLTVSYVEIIQESLHIRFNNCIFQIIHWRFPVVNVRFRISVRREKYLFLNRISFIHYLVLPSCQLLRHDYLHEYGKYIEPKILHQNV